MWFVERIVILYKKVCIGKWRRPDARFYGIIYMKI